MDEYAVQGTSQLAISWWAGFSDPYLITISLSSTAFGPLIGLEDPTVDELIVKSAAEVDAEKRLAIVKQLEAAIATTANFQPLVTRDNFIAYRNDQVGNVSFAAADGFGLPLWHRVEHWQRTA